MRIGVSLYKWLQKKIYQDPVDRLRERGAVIGSNVHIYDGGGSSIDYGFAELLEIGDNVTISNSTILLHDASPNKELQYVKLGKIRIGSNVFIGAGSILLPNIKIGNKVVVGAGSVVCKNIPDNSVAAGNPIRILGSYDAYMSKCEKLIDTKPHVSEKDFGRGNIRPQINDWAFLGK